MPIFGIAGAKKPRQRHTSPVGLAREVLVKKVLSPLRIRSPDHPHDMPAGVERERPGLLKQLHIGLSQQSVALATVARMAAGHQVFPRGRASARTRYHVVQREITRWDHLAAILAGIAITQQDVFA